jgi:glycosyltransferase involved in cell wall biosynthesis
MCWVSKSNIARPIKMLRNHIDWIVTWTSVQRDYAVNELGIPPSKIKLIPHFVDQQFWRPMNGEIDTICAAGQEMRDYPTLFEAMRGLNIKCHIAAGTVRIAGKLFATHKDNSELGAIPPNITVGKLAYSGLRALFARSRFVVVPLLPTDTDNGVTVILEAMSMGKAVICTRTKGQVDVIQENKTGIFVPQGDSRALRDAIEYLWNNPEIAKNMGREARKQVEAHHTLEDFIFNVKSGVEEVVARAKREK